MNRLPVIIIITSVGIFTVLSVCGIGVNFNLAPDIKVPPPLSDLFPNQDEGPHQEFKSEKECLVCHQTGVEIPNIGNSPKIKHEYRRNCTSCHLLPGAQI
ncbi:MAG: hypothetical protein CMF96_07620 [Candidatus Marinimicrobia bacterium]|nr:hypothetical protein [Candidatus Neomarinimicrobiota bacterium]|tara:strand:+ start:1550 stop:1849 length:300 start_codon:yes stop_codon:yes gene_type:complete